MKKTLAKSLKTIIFTAYLLLNNLAYAEHITVDSANNYPYKNLIKRTNDVKIFYIENDKSLTCRVEIVLDKMKWTSVEKKIKKNRVNSMLLSDCLPRKTAEEILLQTFLQFGQGL